MKEAAIALRGMESFLKEWAICMDDRHSGSTIKSDGKNRRTKLRD